ncbi:MAG: extracellular solute-binding protein [Anaerolineae bacterium]|nr:extracellular solute-binding protein [Anaerolineae bacterium]
MRRKTGLHLLLLALIVLGIGATSVGAQEKISIVHYFSDVLGKEAIGKIFTAFNETHPGYEAVDNSAGHEDFKTQILVTIAGDNPPDVFSYWAGARTQFVVDAGRLMSLADFWEENDLDAIIPEGVKAAAIYNDDIYLIPMNAHLTGFWYNTKVMADAGITKMPETWDEFKEACVTLKEAGVHPISLGSMNRWPAQYWFDYTVSYTAGAEYRQKLMAGEAKYTDPEVVTAMEAWKELTDLGCFAPDSNAYDWTEAADMVANGTAAMNLMGTWISGYLNGLGLEPGVDYDFFPFPVINPDVPRVTHGTVDGWVVPENAKNPEGAKALLLHFVSKESQELWAVGQGALAASTAVDPGIYSPVMAKAAEHLASVMFLGGYDLSTTPPMAEGGLDMFAMFMNDPSGYQEYLEIAQEVADDVFGG